MYQEVVGARNRVCVLLFELRMLCYSSGNAQLFA